MTWRRARTLGISVAIVALVVGHAWGQTATPTITATITPTSTPTFSIDTVTLDTQTVNQAAVFHEFGTINRALGVFSFSLIFTYDPAILAFISAVPGAIVADCSFVPTLPDAVTVNIGITCPSARGNVSGAMFDTTWNATGAGVSPMHWMDCVLNDGNPACFVVDGAVTVNAFTPTFTPTLTPTTTFAPTSTFTASPTPLTYDVQLEPNATSTVTSGPSLTPTSSPTQTPTSTLTLSPTRTLSPTSGPSSTPTRTPSRTFTLPPTSTPTMIPTITAPPMPTAVYDVQLEPVLSVTPTPSITDTPTVTPTVTASPPTSTPTMTGTPFTPTPNSRVFDMQLEPVHAPSPSPTRAVFYDVQLEPNVPGSTPTPNQCLALTPCIPGDPGACPVGFVCAPCGS